MISRRRNMSNTGYEEYYDATGFLIRAASGVTWQQVCAALDFSNVHSGDRDALVSLLRENGVKEGDVIKMATHSVGGRSWRFAPGFDYGDERLIFFEERCFNGGWYLFQEGQVLSLKCSSATSESVLEAVVQADGRWSVTLRLPIQDDGDAYEGSYAGAFDYVFAPSEHATKKRQEVYFQHSR